MKLLQQFSLSDILIFMTLFILTFKGGISVFEWFFERGHKFFDKTYQKPKEIEETLKDLVDTVEKLTKKVNILVQSDKDAIKAFITKQHHHFCYEAKTIDDQSLDCIEKRYMHYEEQGGNSYIHHLMEELRELPRDINTS